MRNYSDQIFALATNKATSALGVFRVSGKNSIKTINRLTSRKITQIKKPTLCYLLDNNKTKNSSLLS